MGTKDKGALPSTENPAIDEMIAENLRALDPNAAAKWTKSFQRHKQLVESDQAQHDCHELIVGAQLARGGYLVEYERPIAKKTPDWTLLCRATRNVLGIVEVSNYRLPEKGNAELQQHKAKPHWSTKPEVLDVLKTLRNASPDECQVMLEDATDDLDGLIYLFWEDPDGVFKKLSAAIDGKAGAYSTIAQTAQIPLVVAIFALFETGMDSESAQRARDAVFHGRPYLSGLWFVRQSAGGYQFDYAQNSFAAFPITLPSTTWRL